MNFLIDDYKPSTFLRNPHLQILAKHLFQKNIPLNYRRVELKLEDGDFLDLDFLDAFKNSELVILTHGLEGSSQREYITSLAKLLQIKGYNVLAWNMRGCSGRLNNLAKFYHSGKTEDLKAVIEYINSNYDYKKIHLVGFSVGGNITLKYLGEEANQLPTNINSAITFSVPIDLKESAIELSKFKNSLYMKHFIKSLKIKFKEKAKLFPNEINLDGIDKIKNFIQWDQKYTAPLNGFNDVYDYYEKSSSKELLEDITVRTALISAKDDPFLNINCFPSDTKNRKFKFLLTKYGSHLAYISSSSNNWINKKVTKFICEN